MATTTKYNCQIGVVDSSGNVNIIYPVTLASNVGCTANSNISSSATTVQAVINALGSAAKYAVGTGTGNLWTGSTIANKISTYNFYKGEYLSKVFSFISPASGTGYALAGSVTMTGITATDIFFIMVDGQTTNRTCVDIGLSSSTNKSLISASEIPDCIEERAFSNRFCSVKFIKSGESKTFYLYGRYDLNSASGAFSVSVRRCAGII